MSSIVIKFGGESLKNSKNIKNAAFIVAQRKKEFENVIVVASAMGKMTDYLLGLAKKISNVPPRREQDMLISVGERISISLLAMALLEKNVEAISFTGSQAGIITSKDHFNAKIIDVKPTRIISSLKEGKVPIVAGFQGVSLDKEITTLGRGGSDTTAVALASFFNSEVEFYKDVDGFYNKDPNLCSFAKKYKKMSYQKALKYSKEGSQILHSRALKMAKENKVVLHVVSYKEFEKAGTVIKMENSIDKKLQKRKNFSFEK